MDNNNYNPYAGMPQNNGNGQNTNGQNVNQQTGYQNVGSSGTNQANAYGTYYGSNNTGNTGSITDTDENTKPAHMMRSANAPF